MRTTSPQEKRGEGEGGGEELRGEGQLREATVRPAQLVAMTTPSCVAPRNKLLIADTAFPPAHSPQRPPGCRHSSPLLHLFCVWLKEEPNRNPATSQAPKALPAPLCPPVLLTLAALSTRHRLNHGPQHSYAEVRTSRISEWDRIQTS